MTVLDAEEIPSFRQFALYNGADLKQLPALTVNGIKHAQTFTEVLHHNFMENK